VDECVRGGVFDVHKALAAQALRLHMHAGHKITMMIAIRTVRRWEKNHLHLKQTHIAVTVFCRIGMIGTPGVKGGQLRSAIDMHDAANLQVLPSQHPHYSHPHLLLCMYVPCHLDLGRHGTFLVPVPVPVSCFLFLSVKGKRLKNQGPLSSEWRGGMQGKDGWHAAGCCHAAVNQPTHPSIMGIRPPVRLE
jgi:hypothetical protein